MTGNLIDFVLLRNEEQARSFMDPARRIERKLYRAQHPTEIIACKCMDGRLNLALMTGTPPGIISPYRNIGGVFDLGWPYFGRMMLDKVDYSTAKGRRVLVMATYHYSKGDSHRGCAGHKYDTDAARAGAFHLQGQFLKVFGDGHAVVPIVVGMETDEDSLVFHGESDVISIADTTELPDEEIRERMRALYPTMDPTIFNDLMKMIYGNREHIAQLRKEERPVIDLLHKENIIAVGRGFDWFHLPNRALIVGPFAHDWDSAAATAGKIVLGNMKDGRIPKEDGILLFVSSPFRDGGAERREAELKSRHIAEVTRKALLAEVPELEPYLSVLVTTVDEHTRELTVLSRSDK